MKTISSILCIACLLLCGCQTTTNRTSKGRDFDETKVSQIKKGATTADGIVALFGEPDTKDILSANQVMWHYSYLTEMHQTHSGPYMPVIEQTTGNKKNLDILLQDDVVINYAYVNVPIQTQKEFDGTTMTTN